MTPEARLSHIQQTLDAIAPGWPFLQAHIEPQMAELTAQLINQDNEQTRGRIKALAGLIALPDTLDQEREAIRAALVEQTAEQ